MKAARKLRGLTGSAAAHRLNGSTEWASDVYAYNRGLVSGIKRYLDGRQVGDQYIPGVRDFMERVDAPKGVLRYRSRLLGTNQDAPVYTTFEVWVSVPKPKGPLP